MGKDTLIYKNEYFITTKTFRGTYTKDELEKAKQKADKLCEKRYLSVAVTDREGNAVYIGGRQKTIKGIKDTQ